MDEGVSVWVHKTLFVSEVNSIAAKSNTIEVNVNEFTGTCVSYSYCCSYCCSYYRRRITEDIKAKNMVCIGIGLTDAAVPQVLGNRYR